VKAKNMHYPPALVYFFIPKFHANKLIAKKLEIKKEE